MDVARRRVLVVDDNADNLELMVLLLSSDGFNATGVSDLEGANNQLNRGWFHAVVLDCFWEVEFDRLLDVLQDGGWMSRVVLCSGLSTLQKKCAEWGAAAAVEKPFEIEDFLRVINRVADRRKRVTPFIGPDRRCCAC